MATRKDPPSFGGPPSNTQLNTTDPRSRTSQDRRPAGERHGRRFFSTSGLAFLSARHPWRVLGFWLAAIILALVAASGLSDSLTTTSEFTGHPESAVGEQLLTDRLPAGNPIGETIVIRSEIIPVSDSAFQAVVDRVSTNLAALGDLVVSAPTYYQLQASGSPNADQLISADRHATIIPVTFKGTFDEVNSHADAYLNAIKSADTSDVRVLTVGSISANKEFNDIAGRDLANAEKISLPITVVILVLVFGALVAAGVPLVLAFTAILVSVGLTALLGHAMNLSFYVVNMITMIGLAVGIDYALFIITRFREERRRGRPKLEAIERSGATASKAVLFSGITVIFALSGMLLMPSTTFRSLGAGAVLVVLVAVVAMLTLVPALLSLLGDRIDWPRRHRYDAKAVAAQQAYEHEVIHRGFWGRQARVVMRYPVVFVVVAVALLASTAIPYFSMHRGTLGVETLPPGDTKTAYSILSRDFSAGELAPYQIVIDDSNSPQIQAAIDNMVTTINQNPSFVPNTTVEWNQANDLALVTATLDESSNSPLAYDTLKTLRNEIVPTSFSGTGAHVYITGDTAFNADFFGIIDRYTPLIFLWVLGLSFLFLLLVFRSLVVAATAIVMNILSVGATYGLMVLVFQKGYLHTLFHFQKTPTIEAWVPIFLFCVLFGLSMDYQVFLLSRIREHFDRVGDNRTAVAVGLQATARLITGAALIMVVVFGSFASGALSAFEQMGFGLGIAVLIDATIVRSILVPSVMTLLGNANWYFPSWLHWLPDVRIDGDLERPVPSAPPRGLLSPGDD
ncbi:MAG: MMPL family transporter [Nitrolancea sp.]